MKSAAIVIPCRNELNYIGRCLDSILKLDLPGIDLEVLVCDGMSDDGTREVVARYSKEHPHIRLLDNPHRTTPYALNLGTRTAQSDVVIILGAHSEVDPGYVRYSIEELETHPEAGCVGGFVENSCEDELSEIVALATSSPFGVGNSHYRTGGNSGYVDTVLFGAYRREVFDRVGYFDDELTRNQDDELNYRVLKGGYRIFLSERIHCHYYVRSSLKRLFKQYFQYGYWKVYVNLKHRTVTTLRQLPPLLLVLFLILGAAVTPLNPLLPKLYAAGILTYLSGGLLFGLGKTRHPVRLLRLMLIFAVLHLGYGIGYLDGVIRFLLLKREPAKSRATLSR